ncbi:MAG: beta-ketoacyl-[acyl-carrier-protein] synthase family protein [Planctomycetes bacterium]|nr:beta-ketoacyl-[acyl-carrier-protein] synthase family protein [Planctomycetota bacterium]
MTDRIVITGIGIISPVGTGKESFWENLTNGQSGIKPVTLFDVSNYQCKTAGEIRDFDARVYLGQKGIRHFDRTSLLITAAAKLAMDDANLGNNTYGSEDLGIVIGSTFGSINSISQFDLEALKEGPSYVNPMDFPNTVLNAPASRASIFCQVKGLNSTISTGETSAIDAIIYASDFLRMQRVKAVLAGGVYGLTPDIYWAALRAGILSGSKNNGEEICAPFDRRRNGFILGEGAALLILESLEDALRRNATIYAEVKGYATVFNPRKFFSTADRLEGGIRSISLALNDAGLTPRDISYISANANSTVTGDRTETRVIKEVFGNYAKHIPTSAIKSMTGECLDVSGALQAAACIMAINNNTVPPTINYKEADSECDLDCVPNESREVKVDNALINSFSYMGNCSNLIISKYL